MKVWKLFYTGNKKDVMHDKEIDGKKKKNKDFDYYQKRYPLYAITNSKECLDGFLNTRSKDKFIVVKHHMEPDEYSEFTRGKEDKVLVKEVLTCANKNDERGYTECEVVVTNYEIEIIKEEGLEFLTATMTELPFIPPKILTKKLRKALYDVELYPLAFLLASQEEIKDCEKLYGREYMDDIDVPDIELSELDLLMSLFGGTFEI
jgi:hypothetical protein